MRDLEPADDELHPVESPHPWYTETLWFPFAHLDTRRCGTLYLTTRPGLGVSSLTVFWFDQHAWLPWELPYFRSLPQLPAVRSLRDVDIAVDDIRYRARVVEPLQRYAVSYRDGDRFSVDLDVQGVLPVFASKAMRTDQRADAPPPDTEPRHLDQIITVEGEVVLHGERTPISTTQLRDRSWSLRSDTARRRSGYTFGVGPGPVGFHTISTISPEERGNEVQQTYAGFVLRDGEVVDLRSGTREVLERSPAGYALRLRVAGTDVRGQPYEALGTCHGRAGFLTSFFAFDSLVEWDFDGTTVWGEDHDVWSPTVFRDDRDGR